MIRPAASRAATANVAGSGTGRTWSRGLGSRSSGGTSRRPPNSSARPSYSAHPAGRARRIPPARPAGRADCGRDRQSVGRRPPRSCPAPPDTRSAPPPPSSGGQAVPCRPPGASWMTSEAGAGVSPEAGGGHCPGLVRRRRRSQSAQRSSSTLPGPSCLKYLRSSSSISATSAAAACLISSRSGSRRPVGVTKRRSQVGPSPDPSERNREKRPIT